MTTEDERDFCDFVTQRGDSLLRQAVLLTGDRSAGEDLLQLVLLKLLKRWPKLRHEDPVSYARRALTTTAIDESRRRRWREISRAELPDAAADEPDDLGVRDELLTALRGLPPRQRAVLVLRFYEDLSEADIAAELGITPGTVKSTASRALSQLRELLPDRTEGLR